MTAADPSQRSSYLRERAEEARVIAGTFEDAESRVTMLRIAADYERLAEIARRREAQRKPNGAA
jgi:hypothetical protein